MDEHSSSLLEHHFIRRHPSAKRNEGTRSVIRRASVDGQVLFDEVDFGPKNSLALLTFPASR